jgi:hypothetical protein
VQHLAQGDGQPGEVGHLHPGHEPHRHPGGQAEEQVGQPGPGHSSITLAAGVAPPTTKPK